MPGRYLVLDTIPTGSRPAARVLLLNRRDQVLYLHARENGTGKAFWVMPGGGLEADETFEDAAIREVEEETGFRIEPGPCIWTRRHIYGWQGRKHDQYEVFFMARTPESEITPSKPDDYVVGHRWWALQQLIESNESFAPTQIATLLAPILAGNYPREPFDCGV
jgi:8-oxo-dGTP pyrophosphatase MutT (NUDIX family)